MQSDLAAHPTGNVRLRWNALRIGALLAVYLLLDWGSYLYPYQKLNITPWNPLAGLSVFLLWRAGLPYAWVIFLARVAGDILIRQHGDRLMPMVLSDVVVVGGYMVAATVLRSWVKLERFPPSVGDMTKVVAATAGVMAISSFAFACALWLADILPVTDLAEAWRRRFVGDFVGILTLTPLLLLLAHRWETGSPLLGKLRAVHVLQGGGAILLLYVIFGVPEIDEFRFFYLLFLPMIWIAVNDGFAGAAIAVLAGQIALIVVMKLFGGMNGGAVTAIQVLTISLAITGILLGTVVSERRRAETLLKDSETRMQVILATIPDAMLTVRADGTLESANDAASKLFVGDLTDLTGCPVVSLLPDLAGRMYDWPRRQEIVARCRDGMMKPVEVTVDTAAGDAPMSVVLVRDVSERKDMEMRLAEKQTELTRVSRRSATVELASAIAHEINQPLTAIVNYSGACSALLEEGGDVSILRLTLNKITEQSNRAGEIIRGLRRAIHSGRKTLMPERLEAVIAEGLHLIHSDLAKAGVVVTTRILCDLPHILLERVQVQQVLHNLLRNSMEAISAAGTAPAAIDIAVTRNGAGEIQVSISDNGVGLDGDNQADLFQPFRTTKANGMGLGLSISRSIIEAHGGRLWYEPKKGPGACFCFTLPAKGPAGDD